MSATVRVANTVDPSFDTAGGCWQLPVHAPAEVICHNDFTPCNLVFDAGRAIAGVIAWRDDAVWLSASLREFR